MPVRITIACLKAEVGAIYTTWSGRTMTKLRLGSDEHKKLFCREFIDTFHPFEVRDLKWPELSEANLQRVRSMPFWSEAVTTERTAGLRVKLMADAEKDPVIREAIALQAYEESRHAQMLEAWPQAYEAR